jgi:SAM-dependent methyltransferase
MWSVEPQMSRSNRETIPGIEGIEYKEYDFQGCGEWHMHAHFMPRVLQLSLEIEPCVRVLEVGCGNGFTCGEFIKRGCQVVGIDLSGPGDRDRAQSSSR